LDEGRDVASDVSEQELLDRDGVAPVSDQAVAEVASPTQAPQPQPPEPKRLYRKRFVIAYVFLAAAAIAGVAVLLVATTGSVTNSDPAWSSWQPNADGQAGAKQIASHVARQYHLASGEQLVEVFAKPPSVSPADQQIPLHYVVVQRGNRNDDPVQLSSSNTVQYSLCGLGDSCAITKGTPSVQRGTLVRREILELALYTFKYMGDVNNVIAFMPPTPGSTPKYAVFLQRNHVEDHLGKPLTQTLSAKTPLPNSITREEQQTIDATTESRVYEFSLSQAQNGDAVLVLSPIPA
jgi:hypothetical protein